jgi:hypothetical protein
MENEKKKMILIGFSPLAAKPKNKKSKAMGLIEPDIPVSAFFSKLKSNSPSRQEIYPLI